MPKISSAGDPSYAGHEGVVTNAVGEQFEVNPSMDLDGERPDGYEDKPVGEQPEQGDRDVEAPRLVDHRQSEGQQPDDSTKRTAAKKDAPDATKK